MYDKWCWFPGLQSNVQAGLFWLAPLLLRNWTYVLIKPKHKRLPACIIYVWTLFFFFFFETSESNTEVTTECKWMLYLHFLFLLLDVLFMFVCFAFIIYWIIQCFSCEEWRQNNQHSEAFFKLVPVKRKSIHFNFKAEPKRNKKQQQNHGQNKITQKTKQNPQAKQKQTQTQTFKDTVSLICQETFQCMQEFSWSCSSHTWPTHSTHRRPAINNI